MLYCARCYNFSVNDFIIGHAHNSIEGSYLSSVNLADISSANFICELVRDSALDINDVLARNELQEIFAPLNVCTV